MPMDFEWIVPTLEAFSRDNASVKVSVVVRFREPNMLMSLVADYLYANEELLQTALRSILAMYCLDKLLTNKEALISHMQQALDPHAKVWGINVSNVEIRHIDLVESTANVVSRQDGRPRRCPAEWCTS